jgi:tetratricopeptide (TPR) repeat protein
MRPVDPKTILMAMAAMAILAAGPAPGEDEGGYAQEMENAAARLSQKGESAAIRKNPEKALRMHEAAARARLAMDDAAGAMVELYNSAADLLRMGKLAEAEGKISEALGIFEDEGQMGLGRDKDKKVVEAAALACFLKALILTEKGAPEDAGKWTEKAMAHCRGADCAFKGRIMNLQGRLAMGGKDPAKVEALAAAALEANKRENNTVEIANSIRLLAEAAEARGDSKKAHAGYLKALAADRELKLGPKIAMDLLGLARSSASMARMEKAAVFARRALSVSQAAGYEKGAKEAAALLEKYKANPFPSR